MANKMLPASEIMCNYIEMDAIPELIRLGRTEVVEKLQEAIEIGKEKAGEHPTYWEGIRTFAATAVLLARMKEGGCKNGKC